jgi:hypothetical protein
LCSEYGNPREVAPLNRTNLLHKEAALEKVQQLGLPYTGLWNALFAEIAPLFYSPKEDSIEIVGEQDQARSFTSIVDVAAFLAHVLTRARCPLLLNKRSWCGAEVEPALYHNRFLRIEGFRSMVGDMLELALKRDPTLKVVVRSEEWAEQELQKAPSNFGLYLKLSWSRGAGVVGGPLDNDLFPGHRWKRVEEFL